MFERKTVTAKGFDLLAKVSIGGTIEFTKVKTGAGKVDIAYLSAQTDVTQPMQEFAFNADAIFDGDGQVTLQVVLDNDEVAETYECYQLGIYATDPDEGEILHTIIQGDTPLEVPADTVLSGWTAEFNISTAFGGATTVNVVQDPAGMLTESKADAKYLLRSEAPEWVIGEDEEGIYIMKGE